MEKRPKVENANAFLRSDIKDLLNPATDLSRLWRIPLNHEGDPAEVEIALRERIKELNCLYGLSRLAERHSGSMEAFLYDLARLLPLSWQYPDITCTRIFFKGQTYKSKGFRVTKWRQTSRIHMYNEPAGEVEVFYLRECLPRDEGPFLHEERALLDAVAGRIGTIAERISAEIELQEINRQLTVERKALQESNAALRNVLARIEEEKQEIYMNIQANVEKIMMPILEALALESPPGQRNYLEMLKSNLEEITSPFIRRLSRTARSLTPTEIKICDMIRNGLRSKEIARMRGVSAATINRHREHIRKKLKITNSDVNLATYLQTSLWKRDP